MPILVETRGNETFYKNGCLIWNHNYGLTGVINLYYKRFGVPNDISFLDRIRKRDNIAHQQNRKNFSNRVKLKFERKKSFEINQKRDRNDELCYRPEPEEFLRKLSLQDKLDWAEKQNSKKKDERKRKSNSKNDDKNRFSKKRFAK